MQSFVNMPPQLCGKSAKFPTISLDVLAHEPSLFSCSEEGVNVCGGVLSKTALKHVQEEYKDDIVRAREEGLSSVIDVRVQRLMPDMFPSIPGWHCDAVPRNQYHGQPQFCLINPAAFHVSMTVSSELAGVSNTEFVMDSIRAKIFDDAHVYRDLHDAVERIKPVSRCIPDGQFVKFWPKTIHRASPTHRRGWRMFFRFSMYHKPPIANKVQSQNQVYLLSERNGW